MKTIWALFFGNVASLLRGTNHLATAFEEGCECVHIVATNANTDLKIEQLEKDHDFENKKRELLARLA